MFEFVSIHFTYVILACEIVKATIIISVAPLIVSTAGLMSSLSRYGKKAEKTIKKREECEIFVCLHGRRKVMGSER